MKSKVIWLVSLCVLFTLLAFVLPCSAQDPQLPNFDLAEDKAAQAVTGYCHDIYDPASPLLSQDQVKFAYAHAGDLESDVRTCASWFDVKRIAADRKIAMRYCLLNHDFVRGGSAKAAYDACMNQHDVLTALCTQELKNRTELDRKQGIDSADSACPGVTPDQSEYYVIKLGGREDMGHVVVPAAGPALPAILQAPLPKGLLASGKRLDETVPASASSARAQAPGSVPAAGNACSFLTRTEAESILGESVDGRSNTDNNCWFVSVGLNAARRKQVQLSINRSASPDANAVNATRAFLARESERYTMNVRDVDLGDGAIWAWMPSPGRGTIYAFKGGAIAVIVAIDGLAEDVALQQAKKLAAGPLGGAGKSGYAYAAPLNAAEARAAATTVQSPASYRDTWMAQTRIVRGTVSRVKVKFGPRPQWLTIFFKESPDAAFVVCSPYPDMFQETVGDLYRLVGKTLEVTGVVEGSMCAGKAGSIRVLESKAYRVLGLQAQAAGRVAVRPVRDLADRYVGLDICNAGEVDLDALLAKQGGVASTHLAPRDCAHVYEDSGAMPAFVGFAFADSHGQWGTARRLDLLPDFGIDVLTRADRNVSVRRGSKDVSAQLQLLFRPPVPKCTTPRSETEKLSVFASPAEKAQAASFDRMNPPKTFCDSHDYTLNAVAYPDTREVTFEKKCFECPPAHASPEQRAGEQQAMGTMSKISPLAGGILAGMAASGEEQELKESLEGPPEFQRMNWNEMNHALAYVHGSGGRPEEMPEYLIIRGTVSRVEVSPPGASEHWVDVYFRESAEQASSVYETSYGAFNVCTSDAGIFEDLFGPDFRSRVIGQVLEVEGEYQRNYCKGWKGSIRVSLAHQVHAVGAAR